MQNIGWQTKISMLPSPKRFLPFLLSPGNILTPNIELPNVIFLNDPLRNATLTKTAIMKKYGHHFWKTIDLTPKIS